MGEITDMLINGAEYESVPMWRTKEGKSIPIDEMEDSHLINAIKYVKKMLAKDYPKELKARWKEGLEYLIEELEFRELELN
jgi:hypothetical protein